MATPPLRKVEKPKRVRFNEPLDVTLHPIQDKFPGERRTENLKWKIAQAKIETYCAMLSLDYAETT